MHDPFRVLAHAERIGDHRLTLLLRRRLFVREQDPARDAAERTVERLIRLLSL